MRINFPKIILYIVFIVTMASGFVGQSQESSIMSEKSVTRIGEKINPVEVKGIVYFVNDDQLFKYEASIYTFFSGSCALALVIACMRKRSKKS
jgi:hypothetical protein